MQPSHDQLFHFVLRHAAIAAAIEWPTFAAAHERIPGIRLRTHVADLVFVAKRRDGEEFVWFVVEHKSDAHAGWHEQTLRYCIHLRRVVQRARGPLPIVVALLLHHGRHRLAVDHDDGRPTDPFAAFTPRLAVLVVDLAATQPSEPDADLPPLLRLLFRCLQAVSTETTTGLLAAIAGWRELLRAVERSDGPPPPEDALDAIGWYLVENSDLTEQQVLLALSQQLHAPELTMTTGQRIRQESRELGRVEGRVEGRAEALLRQLARRFGSVPAEIELRVRSAPLADLDRWTDRILDATSMAAVFGD